MTRTNPSQGSSFGTPTPTPDDITEAYQQGRREGETEGRKQGWIDVLDILHDDYMSAGTDPESPEGKAILTVTRRTAEKMREALGK